MPSARGDRTHCVAVGAYLFCDGKLLLLKRANPPYTYAPPGGRLHGDEEPVKGIAREVYEETGLTIHIIGVAETWFGALTPDGALLLCINYIGTVAEARVTLSSEHTDFRWVTAQELLTGIVRTVDESGHGYQPRELRHAFELYERLTA